MGGLWYGVLNPRGGAGEYRPCVLVRGRQVGRPHGQATPAAICRVRLSQCSIGTSGLGRRYMDAGSSGLSH
jgi:hypothetical protein